MTLETPQGISIYFKKEGEKTKKRLTGRGKFGNIDKLSQGAELPRLETKKDEKK